jgi:hypothetical protein
MAVVPLLRAVKITRFSKRGDNIRHFPQETKRRVLQAYKKTGLDRKKRKGARFGLILPEGMYPP